MKLAMKPSSASRKARLRRMTEPSAQMQAGCSGSEPRPVSTSIAARFEHTHLAERTKTALQSMDAVPASSPSNMSPPPQAMASAAAEESSVSSAIFAAPASENSPSFAAPRSMSRQSSPRYAPEVIFSCL